MPKLPKHGRNRIPPLPQFILLTDLDDGTEWIVSHAGQRVSINTAALDRGALPPRQDVVRYGPGDGPSMFGPKGQIVMIVRGGRLGYILTPFPPGRQADQSAKVTTRVGVTRSWKEIYVPESWHVEYGNRGDHSLAYDDVSL